jgi:hypothetical protein
LKFINQAKLEDQKKILKFLLKKFGSNLLQGKSLTTISMPLYIFEKRSNLERMAYSLSFAPQYLEKAAGLSDPVEQMKQAFIFGLSTTIVSLNLQKPFNPILVCYEPLPKGRNLLGLDQRMSHLHRAGLPPSAHLCNPIFR